LTSPPEGFIIRPFLIATCRKEEGVLDFLAAIAEAMRNEYRRGRKHTDLARELDVSPRTVSAIVLRDREIGPGTLKAIFRARPAWLRPVLVQALYEYYGCEVRVEVASGPPVARVVQLDP
jgi:hypothetical protein